MLDVIKAEVNRQLKRVVALTLMGSLFLVSVFSVRAFCRNVTINDEDDTISLVTMNSSTDNILEQAKVELSDDDLVIRVDDSDNSTEITIKRALDVTVHADEKIVPLRLPFGSTVDEAMEKVGIELDEADVVSPGLHTLLENEMEISVDRRRNITVNADGRAKEYGVPYGDVSSALSFLEIPLYENDVVNVDLAENVYDGMEIVVERVGYRNKITTKEVPYETVKKDADFLDEGKTQVVTKGVPGESEIVIKETVKDGVVVSSEEIKNKVTVQPIDEVILVGKKKESQTVQITKPSENVDSGADTVPAAKTSGGNTFVDHTGKTVSYSSKLVGSGTAYTANPGAKTSTGKTPSIGTVAVDPKKIPYGTRLYITAVDGSYTYGYATASDTGGALRQGTALVDLYMNTVQDCRNFGRRNVNVYILN